MPAPLVRIMGLKQVQKAAKKADKAYQNAVAAAVYAAGLHVIGESVKVCPKKTGHLRSTHYAKPITRKGKPDCELGYGADYATYVHEMPDSNNFTAPNTGPKFLEKPLKQFKAQYPNAIANATKKYYKQKAGTRNVNANGVPKAPRR